MAWTQDDLDKLNAAIAQGVNSVAYRDRTVTYRSQKEMLELRSMMRSEIATANNATADERVQRVSYSKDYQA